MPVDPLYRYADEVHPSTCVGKDWRYGCWNIPFEPKKEYISQHGWTEIQTRRMRSSFTDWKPNPAGRACAHLGSLEDPACEGCARR